MPSFERCLVLLASALAVLTLASTAAASSSPKGLGHDGGARNSAVRSLGHAQPALARASMALTGLGRAEHSEHGRPHTAAPRGSSPGNLIKKQEPDGGTWTYEWNGAGMLSRVTRPDGGVVEFAYDALGRRVSKKYRGKVTRWIWDGNVPLHEWVEKDPKYVDPVETAQPAQTDAAAEIAAKARTTLRHTRPSQGPPSRAAQTLDERLLGTKEAPITWVFQPESFAPLGKLVGDERFGIVTDHLGTPTHMFDAKGVEVWGAEIDAYGGLRNLRGAREACPFRWPGQYEDGETGLYYNRFRYYDSGAGEYVGQDRIRLDGGLALYAYAHDPNTWMRIPDAPGHRFRRHLGNHSRRTWARVPGHLGAGSGPLGRGFRATWARIPGHLGSDAGSTWARRRSAGTPRVTLPARPAPALDSATTVVVTSRLPAPLGGARADVNATHHAQDSRSSPIALRAGLHPSRDPRLDRVIEGLS